MKAKARRFKKKSILYYMAASGMEIGLNKTDLSLELIFFHSSEGEQSTAAER